MIGKLRLALYLILSTAGPALGQEWELGLFGGVSNYTGELTHDQILYFDETRFAGGFTALYNISPRFSARSNLLYGSIQGKDENAEDANFTGRNLSFRSDIFEVSMLGQFYLTGYDISEPKISRSGSAYLFGGIALFNFDPQAQVLEDAPQQMLDGGYQVNDWVSLQELGTEGQGQVQVGQNETQGEVRELYSLTTFSIPFGIGYKYPFGDRISLGFEVGTRLTFTDYLDDVSKRYPLITENNGYQNLKKGVVTAYFSDRTTNGSSSQNDFRGDPTDNDWYHFAGFTLTYTIMPDRCFYF